MTREAKKTQKETIKVPVLGAVSCGIPKYAEENIEEYVRLPVALFGRGQFFILRASGDSMIGVGINDGDLVLIRQQDSACEGQIVIALMDDEATLKRYYPEPEKDRIRLHPENEKLEDIFVKDCIIQGVAVRVIKDLI
ncbi:MAG: transcriptional repressor LexA [Lachnospiraceae bacterium]|nr:transcriptional repressor LexA [Lachnospiraceae bacterium]